MSEENKSIFTAEEIAELNKKHKGLTPIERIKLLYEDFGTDEIMLTSSFAATSAFLLKLFTEVKQEQKVFFIDTGYHFEETLIYKDYLSKLYNLNVVEVRAEDWKHEFTQKDRTWEKDPDYCCQINKVEPLESIKKDFKVWVSGLMKWQSDHRSSLDVFEERNGMLKFYPLLDVTREEREEFIKEHHLPFHPLISKGYYSIGCSHCTKPGKGREGRWNNSPKTECGLHL
ncbi:phosphoadenylyl-sulfate reductase [Flavobacteriales bacterium]|jgi:phosphoadenosine phosphosulfate reductase|nr:phosphoadenylyl-sulfate reductase [Flavobacteriales bacterium]